MNVSISIDVPNVEQAITFYTQALGCTGPLKKQGLKTLNAGNVDLYLLDKEADTCPLPHGDAKRSYERHWTPIHLDFLVDDVAGAVKKIVELGGTSEGGEKGDWGEIAYCSDPFGNGFCLIRE